MRFLAIEHVLPSRVVTNDEVLERVRAGSGQLLPAADLATVERLLESSFAACDTRVRYHRAADENAFDLAAEAGERALERAGIDRAEIDLLLYTGVGRGVLEPASATAFQARLGLTGATAFDVCDACASWVRSLEVAQAFLAAGRYRNVMILNAEFGARESYRYALSHLEEYLHWHPSVTVGEAATATVLTASAAPTGFDADFRTHGEKWQLCYVPLPGAEGFFGPSLPEGDVAPLQFVSYGTRLMEFAGRKLVEHYRQEPRFSAAPPDVVFGHAASDGMSRVLLDRCDIDHRLFHFGHRHSANTVSASVPVAMSRAAQRGELRDGSRVLLLVASSGVTTALSTFVYHT
ncbi:3-oxoacyl-[acyl-carrier-protein] synthase 3 [Pilimelia terevasa]|uniref:3-oxoacyl-[acyl-carrier-protein] synthase 3 n=1 Tax=Pilimelia terevasa TaxID=53372 RepID=A0A8J3BNA2_9ACTN|nr:3-oxoacyl-[acyl-carrier-protein] synthase III C-terminal domain-containing protein [Pilimelia terevasa]GGK33975.1 3-oxoacyl-[acyl-carrier-protein] synthase 3 [Pilimelia terevasa]